MYRHRWSKLRQCREFGSEIRGGQTKRFVFPNAWVRTKQTGNKIRDSLRTGYFLEVLTPRPALRSVNVC